jgi:hypothetical protein
MCLCFAQRNPFRQPNCYGVCCSYSWGLSLDSEAVQLRQVNGLLIWSLHSRHSHAGSGEYVLVDGDLIANITLLDYPAKKLLAVMKEGKLYNNMLQK